MNIYVENIEHDINSKHFNSDIDNDIENIVDMPIGRKGRGLV